MAINMKQKQNERKVKQGTGTGREKAIHGLTDVKILFCPVFSP